MLFIHKLVFLFLLFIYSGLNSKVVFENRNPKSKTVPLNTVSDVSKTQKKTILKKDENPFAQSYSKRVITQVKTDYIWVQDTTKPFTELILSWNAFRPNKGNYSFFVSAKYNNIWSSWHKINQWNKGSQETFLNSKNTYVKTKHVRLEMQKSKIATAFRVKVVANNGADLGRVKMLFASACDMNKFAFYKKDFNFPSTIIKGVPRISQWNVKHHRAKDLCSPTSTSMIMAYFAKKGLFTDKFQDLKQYVSEFAEKVRDGSYLDIYGAWPLNVSQVFQESGGRLLAKVKRLNGINELYGYLRRKIPVAVSVRGHLRGGFKRYDNGHFIIVVGWDKEKNSVLCIDPAFVTESKMLRAYNFKDFMHAWGVSRNLAYIMLPAKN